MANFMQDVYNGIGSNARLLNSLYSEVIVIPKPNCKCMLLTVLRIYITRRSATVRQGSG